MSIPLIPKAVSGTIGTVGLAAVGMLATSPAQAASLNFTSTISLFSNSSTAPLTSSVLNYTKTDVAPQLVNYTLNSASLTFNPTLALLLGLQTSYTRDSLNSDPTAQALVTTLTTALLPPEYAKYRGLLTSFLTPNAPVTYQGNGDFPPADFTYAFSGQVIPDTLSGVPPRALLALRTAFAAGGRVTFSSVSEAVVPSPPPVIPPTEAVPEPTTMAGLALASAGMAIVRRKRQKDAA